jgi:hypothetical protein
MKIDKKSWHFKFLRTMGSDTARDLDCGYTVSFCQYTRSLMWYMVGTVIFVLFVSIVSIFGLAVPFLYTLFGIAESAINYAGFAMYFTILGSLFVLGIVASFKWFFYELKRITDDYITLQEFTDSLVPKYLQRFISVAWLYNWKKNKPMKSLVQDKPKKEPSIFYSWYRSFKSKICPVVELEK